MDSQIKKRANVPVEHHRCTSKDSYGDKTFADTPVPLTCYKAGKITIVRNIAGDTVQSSLQLYFDELLDVSGNDEFQFVPDTRKYPVLAFTLFPGLKAGTGTTVVYL